MVFNLQELTERQANLLIHVVSEREMCFKQIVSDDGKTETWELDGSDLYVLADEFSAQHEPDLAVKTKAAYWEQYGIDY